jgi:hypothetical protein
MAETLPRTDHLALSFCLCAEQKIRVEKRTFTSTYVIGIVPFKTRGHPNLIKFSLETDFVEGHIRGCA